MARNMVFKQLGKTTLEEGTMGIWRAVTDGHPKFGLNYDTYKGFVIESHTYEDVVSAIKRHATGSCHDDYVWKIRLVGVALGNRKRTRVVLDSFKAG